MTMLTVAELAQLRADVLETLPETVTIQRATTTVDSDGNWSEGFATSSTVAGRIDPFSPKAAGADGLVAAREASISWYQLTLPWNADLRYGDRVLVGGDTYELVQLSDDHSYRAVRRAVIAKIQGAA